MAIEFGKMLPSWWKKAALLSAAWGAVVGAISLIINAAPELTVVILAIVIPLSLVVPALIGFIVTKAFASNGRIELKPAAINGAKSGVIYAIIMIGIALFFIVFNYLVSALVWGESEILVQGIIVVLATLIIGLPVTAILGVICGGIGGAVYSVTKK